MDHSKVSKLVSKGRVRIKKRALRRMEKREIAIDDIVEVLENGEEIEDYPEDKPLPSALYLGMSGKRPLHVVVALDSAKEYTFIITVYEPDLSEFEKGFRKRRVR